MNDQQEKYLAFMSTGTPEDVIRLCEIALRNAKGAYKALRSVGADKHLPGLESCEKNLEAALKAINDYLKPF